MKSAALFIHSRYPKSQLTFYKKLCKGKFKVAVDGGYGFFKKAGINPDIIIGDFDSLNKRSVKNVKTVSFPKQKDQTDTELAIRYCLKNKFKSIDIVMPTVGEPDHFMGLISNLAIPEAQKLNIRIINHKIEIKFLKNEKLVLKGRKGNNFSIKAVCNPILVTFSGTKFPARKLKINPWETIGLRNSIVLDKAEISVKGRALFFLYHKQKP